VRILIADDDAISRRLLEKSLTRLGHDVAAVADGQAALTVLLSPDGPRLAILDWMMPGADGPEVCRAVRARPTPYVYIIFLTSRDRREDMFSALDAGADDFLTKPLDIVELRARLRSGERIIGLQEQLQHQASHDHLTGLWNRRAIRESLEHELNRASREGRPLAIALADIDHFKEVNDHHGHAAGDEVLRETVTRMRSVMRDYDAIGRYGGEEFLMILPGCQGQAALDFADRACEAVASAPMAAGRGERRVTISLGVAWTTDGQTDADALIQLADAALYRAKAGGRNCVRGMDEGRRP
jgi:diguanylate cyclase (GGDEF)-like protein